MDHMGQVFLHGHCGFQVAVPSSSEVQRDGGRIPADESMKLNQEPLPLVTPTILGNIGIRDSARTPSILFFAPAMTSCNCGLDGGFVLLVQLV